MSAHATIQPAGDRTQEQETGHDCGCGRAHCGGCRLECLERPRYFCGQLLTDSDLAALVEWTRARLALVRHRDGWGVVCGLDVHCDPRKPSAVEIGEGYAVSCCGSDIVVCKSAVIDLSDACRRPESLCDDPCAPAPAPAPVEPEAEDDTSTRDWRSCPEGDWFDVLIDAADEEAGGRPGLSTNGCRRIGSCEASRVRETHRVIVRPSRGDPLKCAEGRWRDRYDDCVAGVLDAVLPQPGDESEPTYGQLRQAVERFALDHACEGGCGWLRWICPPGAPPDDTALDDDDVDVVQRIRLALLLDCLTAVGRCSCAECDPGTAVLLARVRVAPGRTADCPCRVVAVDDAPPYRRLLGRDCPPAGLGRVNLGDLIGQRPRGVCLEVARRGLEVVEPDPEPDPDPPDARGLLALLGRLAPPIFDCHDTVGMLTIDDECLGPRVVGFMPVARKHHRDLFSEAAVADEPAPASSHPLLRIDGMTPHRIEGLVRRGITTFDDVASTPNAVLQRVFPGRTKSAVDAIREQARTLAGEQQMADEGEE